jgi:hypothetical protein
VDTCFYSLPPSVQEGGAWTVDTYFIPTFMCNVKPRLFFKCMYFWY